MPLPRRADGVIDGNDWDTVMDAITIREGYTAYVGFDTDKADAFTNYFLCNGTADDVQIQAAHDYVAALGGGSVYLERGTYDITAEIKVTGKVLIQGSGADTASLKASTNDMTIISFTTVSRAALRDVELDGDGKASMGLSLVDCRHSVFRNLYVTDVDYDNTSIGVSLYGGDNASQRCTWNLLDKIFIYDCHHGLVITKTDGDSWVNANWFYNIFTDTLAGDGIDLRQGAEVEKIVNNKFVTCGVQNALGNGIIAGGIGNVFINPFLELITGNEIQDEGDRTEFWGRDPANVTIVGATRTIINGLGNNGTNDPTAAGNWNGAGFEGVMVKWDSAGPTHHMSIYTGGAWWDWVVT